MDGPPVDTSRMERNRELGMFLLLAVVLFPVLSVLFVSAYGFLVWFSQMAFFGPPGSHG